MSPQVRKKISSAKSRIEKARKIAEWEMAWYKKRSGKLWQGWTERSPIMVRESPSTKKDRSFIHTHTEIGESNHLSVPSLDDVFRLLYKFESNRKYNVRNAHVVSINGQGKVVGYFSFRITSKLVEGVRKKESSLELAGKLSKQLYHFINPTISRSKIIRRLRKMGLIVRIVPMPGYEFKYGIFIEK